MADTNYQIIEMTSNETALEIINIIIKFDKNDLVISIDEAIQILKYSDTRKK